jgi:hypothetical protein
VPILANDIAWSAPQGKIYAVVSQLSPTDPETLAEIDPVSAAITRTLALPGNPHVLAVSDDGSYAYIGFSDMNIVERVVLANFTADIQISLGGGATTGPIYAGYLAAVPSEAHSIVVSTYANANGLSSYNAEGVFVFDDLVARGSPFGTMTAGPQLNSIVFGASTATLYALEPNFQNLSTLSLGPGGLSQVQVINLGQTYFGGYLNFANGLLYDVSTRSLNPVTGNVTGQFLYRGNISQPAVTVDASLNRAYIYFEDESVNPAALWTLQTFNLQTMTSVALARTAGIVDPLFPSTLYPGRVIRWGSQGLAINGETGVALISGAFVIQ